MSNDVNNQQNEKTKKSKKLFLFLTTIFFFCIIAAFSAYYVVFSSNFKVNDENGGVVNIANGQTFDDVVKSLNDNGILESESTFRLTAKLKRYGSRIKPGHYVFTDGESNFSAIRKLASGNQTPVKLTFNNVRTSADLAGRLSQNLQMDSLTALNMLNDNAALQKYGVDSLTVLALFIPNTYELYWNISPVELMDRMQKEYNNFWNADRMKKLERVGLTKLQVSTLASIVEEETIKPDEQPVVAGLYLNRLRKGMKLESDPTVKFAMGDFTIKRVLTRMLATDSPYNTYKYAGLPPGPIRVPSISAINGVLNYKDHNYIYMCAKEDFSGYHNFAVTEAEHLNNARRYQQKLNELHIMK